MKKYKLLAATMLALSFGLMLLCIGIQLQARKQQLLCCGYLYHWNTALQIYIHKYGWKLKPQQNSKQWLELIRSYLYHPETTQCPSKQVTSASYSYRLNSQTTPNNTERDITKFPTQVPVILFDACPASTPVSQKPRNEIAYRHLGGANFLLLDGTVIHRTQSQQNLNWQFATEK